ncbi:MAG TPA: RidA family protein [Planctomycetota bacterium]|nr:RidA family protein [Planctomycetota bacterium]
MSQVEARLAAAGLALPRPSKAVGLYAPAVRTGNLLVISGHGPLRADRTLIRGRVGEDVTVEQATEAATVTALNTLATIKKSLGSLDNVVQAVKVLGLVRAVPDFTEQPKVLDGFTRVLQIAFGEAAGSPARSAIGVASLPDGICVEVESIFEVR